jgi:methionine biosynthesis protein MetW
VLSQLLRIGERIIVSFPNFGHWRIRLALLLQGRMPKTATLRHCWYETPNIHLCTISDFVQLVRENGARIERAFALNAKGRTRPMHTDAWGPNLFAQGAIFVLMKT